MKETLFRVLGRDSNEIGDNLEDLAKELLAKTGFGSFIRNAYKTGAEIDLRATHRVTGGPLLCECKAKRTPLNAPAVRLFYSEWEKQRTADNRLVGLIISTSGFTGTATQWYEELSDEKKRTFRLINAEELLDQLIDCQLTLGPSAIITSLNRRFSIGEFHKASLLHSSHGLSWICEYSVEGRPKFFTIVDGTGDPLPNWKCYEIVELLGDDSSELSLFGIDVRRKVQTELLKKEDASVVELSKAIEESETDVALALEILLAQGILAKRTRDTERYRFVRDVVPFVNTAREFLETEDAVLFLKAKYGQEMIYSPSFLSYIDNRYRLGMSEKDRRVRSGTATLPQDGGNIRLISSTSCREHQTLIGSLWKPNMSFLFSCKILSQVPPSRRDVTYIEGPSSKRFRLAPAERNGSPTCARFPETLRSAGARVVLIHQFL